MGYVKRVEGPMTSHLTECPFTCECKNTAKKKKPFTVILLFPHIQINLDAFSRRSMVEAQGSF